MRTCSHVLQVIKKKATRKICSDVSFFVPTVHDLCFFFFSVSFLVIQFRDISPVSIPSKMVPWAFVLFLLSSLFPWFSYFFNVFLIMSVWLHASTCMWRWEGSFVESVRDWTQVISLRAKPPFLLPHLAGPSLFSLLCSPFLWPCVDLASLFSYITQMLRTPPTWKSFVADMHVNQSPLSPGIMLVTQQIRICSSLLPGVLGWPLSCACFCELWRLLPSF